jgi:hypothetical protein
VLALAEYAPRMPNPLFVADARLRIEAAIASAKHAKQIGHPGLAGEVREILVRELLRPFLPPSIEVGTGKIVDHRGNQSRQIDVVIYDRSVMPALLYGTGGSLGLYPVEACIYAIEVKTTSTAQALRKTAEVARSVSELKYLAEYCPHGFPIERVISSYFAFGSEPETTSANRELKRWQRVLTHFDLVRGQLSNGQIRTLAYPPIRVVAVAGQGYGYYDPTIGAGSYGWNPATPNRDELLAFLIGIANTLGKMAGTRRGLPFGRYLA